MTEISEKQEIALFVTCLVDLFRPSIGFASIELLQIAGFKVKVPQAQICCGQPAYNSGDIPGTQALAKQIIETFVDFDYTVTPSGSCAGMLKKHYPNLFKDQPDWQAKASKLGDKTYELTEFLVDVCHFKGVRTSFSGKVTVHDSCSALRESGIKAQPRKLLAQTDSIKVIEHSKAEVCCGFGGTFCIKYAEISNKMVTDKVQDILNSKADAIVSCDLGCLMNIAGKLKRLNSNLEVRHIVELLVDNPNSIPAIADAK